MIALLGAELLPGIAYLSKDVKLEVRFATMSPGAEIESEDVDVSKCSMSFKVNGWVVRLRIVGVSGIGYQPGLLKSNECRCSP